MSKKMIYKGRNLLKKIYLNGISPFLTVKNNLTFLYGHHLGSLRSEPEIFEANLKKLNKYVAFIDFDEACEISLNKREIKHPVACFSFDDGFTEVATEMYPVIRNFNVNCCIFVNPGFIDLTSAEQKIFSMSRYNIEKTPSSWSELSAFVQNGGLVGSHTVNHARLSSITMDETYNEIIKSKATIEERLNTECKYFAWPYGTADDVNRDQLDIILENYEFGFSAIRSKKINFFHERIINRDHFEGDWPVNHIKYFLCRQKF